MLRPATPLAIGFTAAFVLLLLSTISTPIVKSVPLGSYNDYNFGVFGYCDSSKTPQVCSPTKLSYNTNIGDSQAFTLPQGTRHSLTTILVVHPIAAFFTLICTVLAIASHFRGPAHSARYLLFLLIFSFPTLLVTLLAFLVDILLFVPYMKWGGWIVLAATIIICACSVLTCAMRRTLVSRKARKQRVAENVDMNGETYYASRSPPNLMKESPPTRDSQYARAESPPPLEGDQYPGETKAANVATFELGRSRPSTGERAPLNPARDPSIKTTSSGGRRYDQGRPPPLAVPSTATRGYSDRSQRSPVSPIEDDYAYNDGPNKPQMRGGYDPGPMLRSAPSPYGGQRGGFPPRGGPRGGFGPRGGYPPRAGYGRGNSNMFRGGSQQGWSAGSRDGMGPVAAGAAGGMAADVMMGRGQQGPPPGHANGYSGSPAPYGSIAMPQDRYDYDGAAGPYGAAHNGYQLSDPPLGRPYGERAQSPYGPADNRHASSRPSFDRPYVNNRPESPYAKPDGRYASPRPSLNRNYSSERSFTPYGEPPTSALARRQSPGPPSDPQRDRSFSTGQTRDPTSYGFSGRQPSPARSLTRPRDFSPPPPVPTVSQNDAPIGQAIEMDATSGSPATASGPGFASRSVIPGHYIPENHVPVELGDHSTVGSPRLYKVEDDGPVELPSHNSMHAEQPKTRHQAKASSDVYYEDVDPRFAENESVIVPPYQQPVRAPPSALLPAHLAPGQPLDHLAQQNSGSFYSTDIPADVLRTRSPTHSDNSNFTSISQRGINPNWGPSPTPYDPDVQYRGPQDVSQQPSRWQPDLTDNPDFIVPGAELGAGRRVGSGGRSVGRPHGRNESQSSGMMGVGRYPGPAGI